MAFSLLLAFLGVLNDAGAHDNAGIFAAAVAAAVKGVSPFAGDPDVLGFPAFYGIPVLSCLNHCFC